MNTRPYPGPFSPDRPAQRLPWIVLIAIVLVLLALAGLGRAWKTPARPAHKSKPLRARIYELPKSPGSAGSTRHTPRAHHHAPTPPAHPQRAEHARQQARPEASRTRQTPPARGSAQHSKVAKPESKAGKGVALTHSGTGHRHANAHHPHHQHATVTRPAPNSSHVQTTPQHRINWGKLQSQINAAVAQSEPMMPEMHDPHTLVARYYLASLMRKLQHVGDMEYPGNLTGAPILKVVVGSDGHLLHLSLLRSSGNSALDQSALEIARDSAPFAPFPGKLKHQTSHIVLICRMDFEGDRQVNAGF